MDHQQIYFERRTAAHELELYELGRMRRKYLRQSRSALKAKDFDLWKEATEWVEVIDHELAYRLNPGYVDDES